MDSPSNDALDAGANWNSQADGNKNKKNHQNQEKIPDITWDDKEF